MKGVRSVSISFLQAQNPRHKFLKLSTLHEKFNHSLIEIFSSPLQWLLCCRPRISRKKRFRKGKLFGLLPDPVCRWLCRKASVEHQSVRFFTPKIPKFGRGNFAYWFVPNCHSARNGSDALTLRHVCAITVTQRILRSKDFLSKRLSKHSGFFLLHESFQKLLWWGASRPVRHWWRGW